ncbi:TPA: RnaseH, partial [Escherichia coli]|nr:RnaseH [Escherichia coli]
MDLEMMLDEDYKEGICLIDFSQIALSTALVNFPDKEKINLSMIRHLILNSIKFNVKKAKTLGYTKIVLCIDNAKSGYWRRDFAYYYKKNRGKAREESTWDWEGYFESSHKVIDELKAYMPYTVMDID